MLYLLCFPFICPHASSNWSLYHMTIPVVENWHNGLSSTNRTANTHLWSTQRHIELQFCCCVTSLIEQSVESINCVHFYFLRTVQYIPSVDRLFEREWRANLISVMITNWRRDSQQWSSFLNPHHGLCYGLDYCGGWILFHMYGVAACAVRDSKMMTYYQPTQRGCLWPKHSTLYKGCTLKQLDVRRRGIALLQGYNPPQTLSTKSEATPSSVETNNETRSFRLSDMTKAGIFLLRCSRLV